MIVVGELRAWKDLQQRCGHPEPIVCSEETAYLQLWIQQVSQQQDPALMAVHGGMLADRMAWVFVAGIKRPCAVPSQIRRFQDGLPLRCQKIDAMTHRFPEWIIS
ncbi:MAG: hypothetical protein CM15mP120_00670 [Pseudomonadota bacterium]|nr:MAG: hypothetical protein CM15mP120_00670 [Pseudomonadota bacterium]